MIKDHWTAYDVECHSTEETETTTMDPTPIPTAAPAPVSNPVQNPPVIQVGSLLLINETGLQHEPECGRSC